MDFSKSSQNVLNLMPKILVDIDKINKMTHNIGIIANKKRQEVCVCCDNTYLPRPTQF